ncbi:uncharacterized protein LOC120659289 [Panicum virgatum]|uniref:PGG domain-containing protein n=1 Tax=Panicum virgatum TaxID=38727 RepID=A0A8T0VDP3_PANVG|nr:uncharacterized protein LOC120659289 [Panicum virgatum]KAG2631384.1 hypothetical protein PVAP13_2NG025000 [Panicum virgatum]
MAEDGAAQPPQSDKNSSQPAEYQLKEYLLLLATLVATVTYAAGLNLPWGSWLEDAPAEGRLAGDSILRETNYTRYIVFYYFNAISFAASLLVGLLLLLLHRDGNNWSGWLLPLVRTVMVVDLLGLTGAYAVGGSHDGFTTASASVLASAVFAYVAVAFLNFAVRRLLHRGGGAAANQQAQGDVPSVTEKDELGRHKILMVLAVFAATIAYVAGLNPPGGFWRSAEEGHHAAADPVLQRLHPNRYKAFFFCNTAAFAASLTAIMIIVDYANLDLKRMKFRARDYALYGLIVTALLGLGGAYAAGSCRDSKHTGYVVGLILPVAVCIYFQYVAAKSSCIKNIKDWYDRRIEANKKSPNKYNLISALSAIVTEASIRDDLNRARENIQLLAILAATIAYTAGLDPPGGVWASKGDGYNVGDPILLTTHPGRYKAFFYFNSAAFVASLVIMVMLQSKNLAESHALKAAMILDLFGLIGAYAAGSCRDTSTSIYTVALAGGVLIYVVIHIVFFTPESTSSKNEEQLEYKRKVLLLLAILAATLTYQAGLTPPGGLWETGHRAGFPILQDKYPLRYKAFFYCNAASFMASVALIILLLNANMYKPGIRCYALVVCMVAGMVGLMCAYAAGSSMHLRTSIIVLVLLAAVTAILVILAIRLFVEKLRSAAEARKAKENPNDLEQQRHNHNGVNKPITPNNNDPKPNASDPKASASDPKPNNTNDPKPTASDRKPSNASDPKPNNASDPKHCPPADQEDLAETAMYLMLVGILAASVTYLTGLKPPGGMWRDDDNGHSAGNPVLYDINKQRYNAFFYCNSTSFVASITIIALLLLQWMATFFGKPVLSLGPMHTAMVLDMLALLGAYAAGSDRESSRSWKVILLVPLVVLVIFLFWFICGNKQEEPTKPKTRAAYEADASVTRFDH